MTDLITAIDNLKAGRQSDMSQDQLFAVHRYMPREGAGDVEAVPLGDIADPVSYIASMIAGPIMKGVRTLGSAVESAPPIGRLLSSQRGSTDKPIFSIDEVVKANKTARAAGAVGNKAITPRYVAETTQQGESVLNFGAGKPNPKTGKFDHSELIKATGGIVDEYDFGANAVGDIGRKYNTVFASNVLNVQQDIDMLSKTLSQIKSSLDKGSRVVFNYPESPRYLGMGADELQGYIEGYFGGTLKRVGGTKKAPLWELRIQ